MARILVVDDQEDVRRLLRTVLLWEGCEVEAASSAEEGLERCRTSPPDLVVVDNQMPGLAGMDMIGILRSEGFDRPVVGFPAARTPELARKAEAFNIIIVDKADVQKLVTTIRALLAETREAERARH